MIVVAGIAIIDERDATKGAARPAAISGNAKRAGDRDPDDQRDPRADAGAERYARSQPDRHRGKNCREYHPGRSSDG
jgi:hypothetical protein